MRSIFYSKIAADEAQFYDKWNSNTDVTLLNCLITEVISEQAEKWPDQPAVEFNGKHLKYAELESGSNQYANYLREHHGVKEEDRIGIFLNPSLEFPQVIISVLKASAAFVPLDPNYPVDRLAYMVEDANLSLVITTSDLLDKLPSTSCSTLQIDVVQSEIRKCSAEKVPVTLKSSTLAYVIYTSGSTGRPKGVMVEHKGIVNMAIGESRSYHVSHGDRVMQFASFNFDGSICEIFMTLAIGGILCLIKTEERNAGGTLNSLLRKMKINAVVLTPAVLSATPSTDLPDLTSIGSAGESCTHDIIEKWGEGRHFVNAFGPTENTVVATMAEKIDCYPDITIGKPISNVRVYTLDEDNKQVGIGEVGEIAMAGIQVARGYLNQSDLSAERFIKDPLSDDPSALLYKSGDFGRITAEGNLVYVGRKDDQIKLRGQRIELGEIENVINKLASVTHSIILLVTTPNGDKRLVAYICGKTNAGELRKHIASLLPIHMIPNHFIFVDTFPMTPNGKVDKKLLQKNAIEQMNESPELSGPTPESQTEIKISEIWTKLLEVESVSTIDNFFELGGSSLLAAQTAESIYDILNVEPDLKLLTLGTLKELSHHCDELIEKRNNSWLHRIRVGLRLA